MDRGVYVPNNQGAIPPTPPFPSLIPLSRLPHPLVLPSIPLLREAAPLKPAIGALGTL